MRAELAYILKIVESGDWTNFSNHGILPEMVGIVQPLYDFCGEYWNEYKKTPTLETIKTRFKFVRPDYTFPNEPIEFIADEARKAWLSEKLADSAKFTQNSVGQFNIDQSLNPIETLTNLEQSLQNLRDKISFSSETEDYWSKLPDIIGDLLSGKNVKNRFKTGWSGLDEQVLGFFEKDYIAVSARPGQGKTWMMLWFAINLWKQGNPILFVTLELPKGDIYNRMHSLIGRIDFNTISLGNFDVNLREKKSLEKYADSKDKRPPFYVLEGKDLSGGLNVNSIEAKAKQLGVKVIVIDQFSFLQDVSNERDSRRKMANISKSILRLSKDYNYMVIVAVQANRQATSKDPDHVPEARDIYDTDSILQDCDKLIMFKTYDGMEQLTAKVRKSRTGKSSDEPLKLHWNPGKGDISEMTDTDSIF